VRYWPVAVQRSTASPVVLQALVNSVARNGECLALRANGTFDHVSAGTFSETVARGCYARTGSLIHLNGLPKLGAFKRKTLRLKTCNDQHNQRLVLN
jgi:hypothetical protein